MNLYYYLVLPNARLLVRSNKYTPTKYHDIVILIYTLYHQYDAHIIAETASPAITLTNSFEITSVRVGDV